MTDRPFMLPDELGFDPDDDFADKLAAEMTKPLCADAFHDAHQRDDVTNKRREPCPACGGTWVDYGHREQESR